MQLLQRAASSTSPAACTAGHKASRVAGRPARQVRQQVGRAAGRGLRDAAACAHPRLLRGPPVRLTQCRARGKSRRPAGAAAGRDKSTTQPAVTVHPARRCSPGVLLSGRSQGREAGAGLHRRPRRRRRLPLRGGQRKAAVQHPPRGGAAAAGEGAAGAEVVALQRHAAAAHPRRPAAPQRQRLGRVLVLAAPAPAAPHQAGGPLRRCSQCKGMRPPQLEKHMRDSMNPHACLQQHPWCGAVTWCGAGTWCSAVTWCGVITGAPSPREASPRLASTRCPDAMLMEHVSPWRTAECNVVADTFAARG